jgi:hypothetical protein
MARFGRKITLVSAEEALPLGDDALIGVLMRHLNSTSRI